MCIQKSERVLLSVLFSQQRRLKFLFRSKNKYSHILYESFIFPGNGTYYEQEYKVVKNNRIAGLSYLIDAVGTSAGIAASIKVKDYLVNKKHKKAEQKSAK